MKRTCNNCVNHTIMNACFLYGILNSNKACDFHEFNPRVKEKAMELNSKKGEEKNEKRNNL